MSKLILLLMSISLCSVTAAADPRSPSQTDPARIETRVAIQGVCAWPNLQRLDDGTLLVFIYNQPSHGKFEGDIDCWASEDSGQTWRFRGRAVPHGEPRTTRMNCAVGVAGNGDLIVLSSGYTNRIPNPMVPFNEQIQRKKGSEFLPTAISRSSDGGRTWETAESFPLPPESEKVWGDHYVPFGNIVSGADGSLRAFAYLAQPKYSRRGFILRSADDGRTWGDPAVVNPRGSETSLLHLGEGRWLASTREFPQQPVLYRPGVRLELYASADDGRTWQHRGPLSLPLQVTSNLIRLRDGRVLLSFGNRNWNNFGVDVRFSDDEGESWGPPIRIADSPRADSGYPSSVQLTDGRVVTAYYTQVSDDFHYEMRVAIWNPEAFETRGRPRGVK
ncbi:MAG: hypothetical protein CMJ81_20020 [Planctomycetaceae bacterium]|nr:hypothetical protein [Planctomycetaceae bacterium]